MRATDRLWPWHLVQDLVAWRELAPVAGRKYWAHEYTARLPWLLAPLWATALWLPLTKRLPLVKRAAARELWILAIAGGAMAMGNFSPAAPWSLLQRLPVLRDLRVPSRHMILVVLALGCLIAALTYFHVWTVFLLLWVVPMMSWLKVALRLRTIGEHYGLEYDHMLRQTRTTYPNLLEKLLIAPKNIGYHLDHHLYPSVPFYNLPALHRALQAHDEFRTQAHLTHTYRTVVNECTHCVPTPLSAP